MSGLVGSGRVNLELGEPETEEQLVPAELERRRLVVQAILRRWLVLLVAVQQQSVGQRGLDGVHPGSGLRTPAQHRDGRGRGSDTPSMARVIARLGSQGQLDAAVKSESPDESAAGSSHADRL